MRKPRSHSLEKRRRSLNEATRDITHIVAVKFIGGHVEYHTFTTLHRAQMRFLVYSGAIWSGFKTEDAHGEPASLVHSQLIEVAPCEREIALMKLSTGLAKVLLDSDNPTAGAPIRLKSLGRSYN